MTPVEQWVGEVTCLVLRGLPGSEVSWSLHETEVGVTVRHGRGQMYRCVRRWTHLAALPPPAAMAQRLLAGVQS